MTESKYTLPDGEIIKAPALPTWKTPNNHDTNLVSDLTATYTPEESLTKQEFKDDADINVILQRFLRTNEPPPVALDEHFADTTTRIDYFTMQTRLAELNHKFYELPARIRTDYQNDPAKWADAAFAAFNRGDADSLNKMGVEIERRKPQGGDPGTPATPGAPATIAAPAAPAAATPPGAPN